MVLLAACGKPEWQKRSEAMDRQMNAISAKLDAAGKQLSENQANLNKVEQLNRETARLNDLSEQMKAKMRESDVVKAELQSTAQGTPEHQAAKERIQIVIGELQALQAQMKTPHGRTTNGIEE